METSRLRYFCVVVETGSLTKASEIVGMSHSGLSKALSVLQTETGLTLFRPLGRGLEVTQQGQWFYKKAIEILKVESEIRQGSGKEKNMLRIGLSEVLATTCAVQIAQELKNPISFVTTDVGQIESQILDHQIDFGFSFIPAPKADLEFLEIAEVKLNSYCRADRLKRIEFHEIPYVVPATEIEFNLLGYKSRDSWPQDIPREIHYTATSFVTACDLLKQGVSGMYLPDFVVDQINLQKSQSEKIIKISEHKKTETRRKIYLIKSKKSEETLFMKKAAKVVRHICRSN